jgi:predicted lipoprotein with Yx(FWY)xxD motif
MRKLRPRSRICVNQYQIDSNDATATGDWTIVIRSDGSRQWALKGKPVYTRFHDAPDSPTGETVSPAWHLVPYAPTNAKLTAAKH